MQVCSYNGEKQSWITATRCVGFIRYSDILMERKSCFGCFGDWKSQAVELPDSFWFWHIFLLAFTDCHSLLLLWNEVYLQISLETYYILLKIKKEKAKKHKKQGFPCAEVSFLYSSERLLHSGYCMVFTVKPWWITWSLISLISEITHSLWIPGCHLASLTLQKGRTKPVSYGIQIRCEVTRRRIRS